MNKNQFIRCDLKITPWKFTFKNLDLGDLVFPPARRRPRWRGLLTGGREGLFWRTADFLAVFKERDCGETHWSSHEFQSLATTIITTIIIIINHYYCCYLYCCYNYNCYQRYCYYCHSHHHPSSPPPPPPSHRSRNLPVFLCKLLVLRRVFRKEVRPDELFLGRPKSACFKILNTKTKRVY